MIHDEVGYTSRERKAVVICVVQQEQPPGSPRIDSEARRASRGGAGAACRTHVKAQCTVTRAYSVQFTAAAAEKPLTRDPLAQRYVLLLLILGERALPLLAPRLDDNLLDLEGDRARHCLL